MQEIKKLEENSRLKISLLIPILCCTSPWRGNRVLTDSAGGAHTTAVGLTFALHFIVSTPKVWDRLSKEIRDRFKSADEINGVTAGQIVYLDAIIHECI